MTKTPDMQGSEETLPSLADVVARTEQAPQLQCTILFHPQTERIGQHAVLDKVASEWVVGRQGPLFSRAGNNDAEPLADPYVSRRALLVTTRPDGVLLCKPRRASRCRLPGQELHDELFLDDATLERGVVLLLSHSIVLLLRRCASFPVVRQRPEADGMIGDSAVMQTLREQVYRASTSDLDVLIRGETGVGKELVAQAIHAGSGRSAGPLVTVNMAAVPASLAASLLFGNTRGAFSGASSARAGSFREAHGGTLFLDEIGDTPEEVQPLLLRALQQREIQVVGGGTERVDVRVLSATDAGLDDADCSFKSALRHRLGSMEILLPSLREHPEDIGSLLMHFLRRASDREQRADLLPHAQSEPLHLARWASVFFRFAHYHWPGNVRQLENYAAQVVVASDRSPIIPAPVLRAFEGISQPEEERPPSPARPRRMKDISDSEFDEVMSGNGYEVNPVAEKLGVTRQAVYRRIDKSGAYCLASEVSARRLRAVLSRHAGDVAATAAELKVSESALKARLRAAGTLADC